MSFLYKGLLFVLRIPNKMLNTLYVHFVFRGNNVQYSNFRNTGKPYVLVARGGKCSIGANFAMNNGIKGNPIGCYEPCTIFVDRNAELVIGDNVSMSQTAIVCNSHIEIGNNVKLGGGVCVYDSDFHSLNPEIRKSKDDIKHKVSRPVFIKDNAFIGAKVIILKGVTIGENSIVGAGSVLSRSVPDDEIWAGNPAKYIAKVKK